jgi:hypothetical protein
MTAAARRRAAARFLVFVLSAGLGCASSGGAELGKNVTLKLGEHAAFDGDRIVVTFVSVPEDSRCPKDVQCIRAGNARVRLDVVLGSAAPTPLDLEVPGSAVVGEWEVAVERLDPYPVSERPTESKEYLIILGVSRR